MEHQFHTHLLYQPMSDEQQLLSHDGYTYTWYTRDTAGQPWYFSMVDDNAVDIHGDKCDIFIAAALKEEDLTALLTNKLPIRDVLTVKALLIVFMTYTNTISSYFPISKSRLIEDWLPTAGVCLSCKGVENA